MLGEVNGKARERERDHNRRACFAQVGSSQVGPVKVSFEYSDVQNR